MSESSDIPRSTGTHPGGPAAQTGAQAASPRREFLAGLQAELPLLVGVIPFGMIYGALALEADLSPAAAQAMSAIIFAGSAQFVTTQLVAGGAPGLVILLTVAVVNLRHMLYSASVAPHLQHLPLRWKAGLAYLLTDEAYAMAILHMTESQGPNKHWFFLGTGLTLWCFWQLSTTVGILLGAVIPASWGLDFTIALTFIALVIPALKGRPSLAAALTAGIISLLAYSMPYRLGLVVAALCGVAVGVFLESRS